MLFLDLAKCGPAGLLRVIYFFKLILNIVFIVIPIALIILLMVDFSKAVIANDDAAQKKIANLAIKRIFYAVMVFIVPYIVNIFNTVLGDLGVNYLECYNNISIEAIEDLEVQEKLKEEAEKAAMMAKLAAEREAKEEEIAKRKATEKELAKLGKSHILNGSGCDGLVYYSDGTFYQPTDSTKKSGSPETKGSASFGYNKYFYKLLEDFIAAAEKEGYSIEVSDSYYGAWRPVEYQYYYACCDRAYHPEAIIPYTIPENMRVGSEYYCPGSNQCNNGNTAGEVGTSSHGWGIASDLEFGDRASMDWAHENANKYGLDFKLCEDYFGGNCDENWHISPNLIKYDDSVVAKCSQ